MKKSLLLLAALLVLLGLPVKASAGTFALSVMEEYADDFMPLLGSDNTELGPFMVFLDPPVVRNPNCDEKVTLSRDGEVVCSLNNQDIQANGGVGGGPIWEDEVPTGFQGTPMWVFNFYSANGNKAFTKAGTYTVTIPAGFFLNEAGDSSELFELTYYIPKVDYVTKVSFSPNPIAVQSSLSQIQMTLNSRIEYFAEVLEKDALVITKDGQPVTGVTATYSITSDIVVQVSFSPAITEYGQYTLTFPAGTFQMGGTEEDHTSTEIQTTYEVGELVEYAYTVSPSEPVTSLSEISVDFTVDMVLGDGSASYDPYTEGYKIKRVDAANALGWSFVPGSRAFLQGHSGQVSKQIVWKIVPPITEPGTYFWTMVKNTDFSRRDDVAVQNINLQFTVEEGEVVTSLDEFIVDASPAPGEYQLADFNLNEWGLELRHGADFNDASDALVEVRNADGETVLAAAPEFLGVPAEDETDLLLASFGEGVAEAGEYTVVVPDGLFLCNGVELTGAEFHYILLAPQSSEAPEQTYEVSPEELSTVETLDEIVLVYDNYNKVAVNNPGAAYLVRNGEKLEGYEVAISSEEVRGLGGTFRDAVVLTVTPAIEEKMTVSVVIPEGAFNLGADGFDEEVPNEALTLGRYFVVPSVKIEYSIDPEFGSNLTEIQTVTITFDNATEVKIKENPSIYLTVGTSYPDFVPSVEGNVVTLTLPEAVTYEGDVYFHASKNIFTLTINGSEVVYDSSIIGTYHLSSPVQEPLAMPEFDPAAGEVKAEKLSQITLTFPEGCEVVYNPFKEIALFEGGEVAVVYDVTVDENTVVLTADVENLRGSRVYTLEIPEGAFSATGSVSEAWSVEYSVLTSGIGCITAPEAGIYDVYTLTGVCVVRNGSRADLDNLENGLYVVNGVKVAVRR